MPRVLYHHTQFQQARWITKTSYKVDQVNLKIKNKVLLDSRVSWTDRRPDRRTDRHRDRWTDIQTDDQQLVAVRKQHIIIKWAEPILPRLHCHRRYCHRYFLVHYCVRLCVQHWIYQTRMSHERASYVSSSCRLQTQKISHRRPVYK